MGNCNCNGKPASSGSAGNSAADTVEAPRRPEPDADAARLAEEVDEVNPDEISMESRG